MRKKKNATNRRIEEETTDLYVPEKDLEKMEITRPRQDWSLSCVIWGNIKQSINRGRAQGYQRN